MFLNLQHYIWMQSVVMSISDKGFHFALTLAEVAEVAEVAGVAEVQRRRIIA